MTTKTFQRLVRSAPKDKQSVAFQDFVYNFFTNKRKYRPPVYADLIGEGNRCVSPTLKTKTGRVKKVVPRISLHQLVVQTVMKLIVNTPGDKNRGLLAWHSTGSGKLCTATAVMDAFWDTNKEIIYVSSIEGKNSNPPENFYSCASRFLRRFKTRKYSSKNEETRLNLIGNAFKERRVKFMTFAQLAHYLMIYNPLKSVKDVEHNKNILNNTILIIDEVHNIFKPLPTQKGECDALRKFLLDPLNQRTLGLKMVVLTATPGDTPNDIVNLLNMVRSQEKPQITVPDVNDANSMIAFRNSIRGLVSFFDMSGDKTKFPMVVADNKYELPMSMNQYKAYASAYHEEMKGKRTDLDYLLSQNKGNLYLQKARKYSNMMLKYASPIETFSSKIAKLLQVIQQYPNEKHYIYSAFYTNHGYGGQGIRAIANLLEKELGYKRLSPTDKTENLQSAKRFILATTPLLSNNGKHSPGKTLKKLTDVFNSKENSEGKFVNLFLASQAYNEGVDLKGVRHVHIFEPLVTAAAEKQTIGRAVRHCSHIDLDPAKGEWKVQIHRYYSEKPINLSVYDEEQLKQKIQALTESIASKSKELELYKGNRGALAKSIKDTLKQNQKELSKELHAAKKLLRDIQKENLANVQMVDNKVYQDAKERLSNLMQIYKAVHETAVDCMLFKDFHAAAGLNIQCEAIMSSLPSASKSTKTSISNI